MRCLGVQRSNSAAPEAQSVGAPSGQSRGRKAYRASKLWDRDSLGSAHKRLGGTDRWVRWRGNRRAEGGPLTAPPPPPGHPSKAGKGETRSMGWDRSVHNGVSPQVQKTGRAEQTTEKAIPWRFCRAPAATARVGAVLRCPGELTGWKRMGTCVSGRAGVSCTFQKQMRGKEGQGLPRSLMRCGGGDPRRGHLLLIIILAVELLVPVEAGGLQRLFAGGTLHALLMPEAVVEPQQKPIRDDPLTALADRLRAHRSAYSSNRHPPMSRAGPAPPHPNPDGPSTVPSLHTHGLPPRAPPWKAPC